MSSPAAQHSSIFHKIGVYDFGPVSHRTPDLAKTNSRSYPVLCLHTLAGVRVCITKRPTGIVVEGVNMTRLIPGECYDLSPSVAEYLVLNGYAVIEMRSDQRTHRPPKTERRRFPR